MTSFYKTGRIIKMEVFLQYTLDCLKQNDNKSETSLPSLTSSAIRPLKHALLWFSP